MDDEFDLNQAKLDVEFMRPQLPSATPAAIPKSVKLAAVLSDFTEDEMASAVGYSALFELLSNCEKVRHEGRSSRNAWRLISDVRRDVLQTLISSGELNSVMQEADSIVSNKNFQQLVLAQLLKSRGPVATDHLTREQLYGLREALSWLPDSDKIKGEGRVPLLTQVEAAEELELITGPLKRLVGDHFRGRREELTKLRSFVDVLDSQSPFESLARGVSRIWDKGLKAPLVVTGPGGMGKSTLMAKFILDHCMSRKKIPFAYLDLDRSTIRSGHPLPILSEALLQLSAQFPQIRRSATELRSLWLTRYRAESQIIRDTEIDPSRYNFSREVRAFRDFLDLIFKSKQKFPTNPVFLMVLDTFEEYQYSAPSDTAALMSFLRLLTSEVPCIKIVLSGRAPVEGFEQSTINLDRLDDDSVDSLLNAAELTTETRKALVKQISGNPLTLKLAIELSKVEKLDKDGFRNLRTHQPFWKRLEEEQIQAQLYARILEHIHDENVRRIAFPGLILRRITPEIIFDVLNRACNLKLTGLEQAIPLFEKLKQEIALVERDGTGAVRHKRDLRSIMLKLMLAKDVQSTTLVNKLAVQFYCERELQSPEEQKLERAEELYHRIMLREPEPLIRKRWLPNISVHLMDAFSDLDQQQQAQLASLIFIMDNRVVAISQDVFAQASMQDWETLCLANVEKLLEQGDASAALNLLRSREERSPASLLYAQEIDALNRLGKFTSGWSLFQHVRNLPSFYQTQSLAAQNLRISGLESALGLRMFADALQILSGLNNEILLPAAFNRLLLTKEKISASDDLLTPLCNAGRYVALESSSAEALLAALLTTSDQLEIAGHHSDALGTIEYEGIERLIFSGEIETAKLAFKVAIKRAQLVNSVTGEAEEAARSIDRVVWNLRELSFEENVQFPTEYAEALAEKALLSTEDREQLIQESLDIYNNVYRNEPLDIDTCLKRCAALKLRGDFARVQNIKSEVVMESYELALQDVNDILTMAPNSITALKIKADVLIALAQLGISNRVRSASADLYEQAIVVTDLALTIRVNDPYLRFAKVACACRLGLMEVANNSREKANYWFRVAESVLTPETITQTRVERLQEIEGLFEFASLSVLLFGLDFSGAKLFADVFSSLESIPGFTSRDAVLVANLQHRKGNLELAVGDMTTARKTFQELQASLLKLASTTGRLDVRDLLEEVNRQLDNLK